MAVTQKPSPETAEKCMIIENKIERPVEPLIVGIEKELWAERKPRLFEMSVTELEDLAQAIGALVLRDAMDVIVAHIVKSEQRRSRRN
jgi:hypothetical protein